MHSPSPKLYFGLNWSEQLRVAPVIFRRLSEFSSDLAHELRTPISNLLTQTQVVLAQPRGVAEYQDTLASNAEEFQRLARMVSDMLLLAKAEHGLLLPSTEEIVLQTEVSALMDFYEALADEKSVSLHCSGDGRVLGDRLMLRRAISNLDAVQALPLYPLLFDPQTAGGLLAGVPGDKAKRCVEALQQAGYVQAAVIGMVLAPSDAMSPIKVIAGSRGARPDKPVPALMVQAR